VWAGFSRPDRLKPILTLLFFSPVKLLAKRARWRAVLQSWFLENTCQQIRDAPCEEDRRGEGEELWPGVKIEQEEEGERKKDAHDDGAD
jgi:hypothetical protein